MTLRNKKLITKQQFNNIINSTQLAVLYFYASWSSYLSLESALNQRLKKHKYVTLLGIDVEENEDLSKQFDVSGIPITYLVQKVQQLQNEEELKQKDFFKKQKILYLKQIKKKQDKGYKIIYRKCVFIDFYGCDPLKIDELIQKIGQCWRKVQLKQVVNNLK